MKNVKRKHFLILLLIFLLSSISIYNKTHIKNYTNYYLTLRKLKKQAADAKRRIALLNKIEAAFQVIENDYEKGLFIIQNLADEGEYLALANLGSYHISGQYGVKKNFKKGVELIERAYKKAREYEYALKSYDPTLFQKLPENILDLNPDFMSQMGNAYLEGDDSLPSDIQKGILYLDKAAKLRSNMACHLLAQAYLYGHYGIKKNPPKGLEYAVQAADRGYVWAQLIVGLAHMGVPYNSNIPPNIEKGIAYLTLAANNDGIKSSDAPHRALANQFLASIYLEGTYGIKIDRSKGLAFMHQAANLGNSQSAYLLGLSYLTGLHGLPVNYQKAEELLFIAASRGHDSAQVVLGSEYAFGENFSKDIERGLEFLHKAADQNNHRANLILGEAYIMGSLLGIQQDIDKGLKHLKIAADGGDPEAQFRLARIFSEGSLVDKDLKKTQKYLAKSAAQGNKKALAVIK